MNATCSSSEPDARLLGVGALKSGNPKPRGGESQFSCLVHLARIVSTDTVHSALKLGTELFIGGPQTEFQSWILSAPCSGWEVFPAEAAFRSGQRDVWVEALSVMC
jgi:hypothetical protein